jgi:hypothetical protein
LQEENKSHALPSLTQSTGGSDEENPKLALLMKISALRALASFVILNISLFGVSNNFLSQE